jgi:hypothetical protein
MRCSADLVERPPAVLTQSFEAGELRLDRDAGRPGRLDQPVALLVDRNRRPFGDVAEITLGGGVRRQGARIRIQPEADLAAALLDERGQPVGEGACPVSRRP